MLCALQRMILLFYEVISIWMNENECNSSLVVKCYGFEHEVIIQSRTTLIRRETGYVNITMTQSLEYFLYFSTLTLYDVATLFDLIYIPLFDNSNWLKTN